MSVAKVRKEDDLHLLLNQVLRTYEVKYGITPDEPFAYSARLIEVIKAAAALSHDGRAVVLIDEYDSPMLDSLDDEERLAKVRNTMRDFYSPLKHIGYALRFLFLTGITKFSQLSIFSELNNLDNISMVPGWDAICGITEEEIHRYMGVGLEDLAQYHGCDKTQMMDNLKEFYDGYHFTEALVDVYNPFSLVRAFKNKRLASYWFESGTPTWLLQVMSSAHVEVDNLDGIIAKDDRFDRPAERVGDAIPVLFQSGYLTIKDYNASLDLFTLGVPNKEVRKGLAAALIEYVKPSPSTNQWLLLAYLNFLNGKNSMDEFMEALKDFYASIPYDISNDNERHYQAILYAVLTSFGADVTCEDRTANGRADLVWRTPDAIYIIELKYGKTVAEAVEQLRRKDYAAKYRHDGRPVRLLAVNLATATRTLDAWALE